MSGRKAQKQGRRQEVTAAGNAAAPHNRAWAAVGVAAVVLLAGGWAHRALVAQIDLAVGKVAELSRPLTSLPLELGGWHGQEIAMDDIASRVAWFDDEYINRSYAHRETGRRVGLFVGYVGRPRAHFGHRPDVCYAAHGAELLGSQPTMIEAADGVGIPGMLYEFQAPGAFGEHTLVLATYVINGGYTNDPRNLHRFNSRSPGLLGERPAYMTRVQISTRASSDRDSDVAVLCDLAVQIQEPILNSMPYVNG
ncbi:MAG: exosortase-associated EpsI family protein [Phycisphaerales bacterium]|nr:MAG: exosortase-associated EpsI family protein [Phycisphaerales bacterium]